MIKKTVIIGGVAGGATAATRLRRRDEKMEIVLFERGEYISYANCGLPYHVGDVIKDRDSLLVQTPSMMKKKYNIDVRISSEVIKINREAKTVTVRKLEKTQDNKIQEEVYDETYDALIIATGSSPLRPPIPGIDRDNIFTLWTVPDTDNIKKYIEEQNAKSAVVIGGGFIGLEMAENLQALGLSVSIVEMQDQVMAPIDFEMAQLLHENLWMNNVNLILGDGVKSFINSNQRTSIELSSGKKIETDMVILSIGVRPNSSLAKEAGLSLNTKGGIIVDSHLLTSDPSIYAVGDVIEVENFILKSKTMIPLAGPANKQARIAADNIVGDDKEYKGSMGTAVAKVFDLVAASVGVNEKTLKAMGKIKDRDYYTAMINQKSHAGYYPGATPITLKLIFDEKGKIFGGQMIGQDGVDKRIDTLAVVIRMNGTVYDLQEMELSYAPPFSSAKDPINMLGFVAENILQKRALFIGYEELDQLLKDRSKKDTYTVLDVMESVERMAFSISNSYHIPLGQLRERVGELDKEKLIIVYCTIGVRSYNGARVLMQNGFKNVKILAGGTSFYKSMHYIENNGGGCKMLREEFKADNIDKIVADKEIKEIDCSGLQCPGPIMKVYETLNSMENGQILKVSATDMGFARDIDAWCKRTGNTMMNSERKEGKSVAYLRKGTENNVMETTVNGSPQGKTIIVFSGDLDKVLASFIIANGAAAMGRPVTMFFTFWGLNALRREEKVAVKKPFIEKMFGKMMPRGTGKLKLSNMNMAGMGTKMMKKVMKDKNVDSLPELMKKAQESGIKLVACTMSMDVMGITKEELIDGVELAGVASYLGDAEESNVNLFV